MKKCPYCAEEIQDEAIICRFCNRTLPIMSAIQSTPVMTKQVETKPKSYLALYLVLAIVGVCIVFFILISIFSGKNKGATSASGVQYQIVAHRGVIYYIVVDSKYNSDRANLESVGKNICGSETICQVWYFNNKGSATGASETVDSTQAIAIYEINRNTGYEEMLVCALGDC